MSADRSYHGSQSSAAVWGARITTGIFSLVMTFSAAMYLVGPPPIVAVFHHLGYPDYFRVALAVAKLLGIATILVGGRAPRLREWAYAGFTFDLIAAAVSHAAIGEAGPAFAPLIALSLMLCSYFLWHRPRTRE